MIIIDAGHGGIDSGAVSNQLLEKDLNLRASLYLYNRLKELGVPVKLTRDSDEYLPKDERVRRINNMIDDPNTILISNHMNAGNGEGAEIVYSLRNNNVLPELILSNIKDKGQKIRKTYQRRLPEDPNKDYYYILRETNAKEPLLIEYGFIDNKNDSKRLNNNLEDYVEGVVEALTTYLNYPYIPKDEELLDYYTVQKGDTLYKISNMFNIPINKLKEINNLSSDILSIGQKIYLIDNNYDTYNVVKGDSLYSISRKFNIPVNELIDINNLNNLTLQINQQLLVPKSNNNYIVEKGDTLWSIAKKFNTTVNSLKEINNLDTNTISIGQILLIK